MNIFKRCRHGLRIVNTDDKWEGRALELYGESCQSKVELLCKILKPENLVFDIGAGTGNLSIPMSRKVGDNGFVIAYEPERHSFYQLCGNVSVNNLKNVYCYHTAIGSANGQIDVPEINSTNTDNFGGLRLNLSFNSNPVYQVQITTLDSLAVPRCDLIKIDVEGMEYDVLKGGINLINKWRPFIYLDYDNRNQMNIFGLLKKLDYNFYIHDADIYNSNNFFGNQENVFVTETTNRLVFAMLFCVPKEKEENLQMTEFNLKSVDTSSVIVPTSFTNSGTTTLSKETRDKNNDFQRYLFGNGIDIGGGYDALQTPYGTVRVYDIQDGDAKDMANVEDNQYDFVYSAHCLEHLTDVELGLKNWTRILKPDGYLFVCVPDWVLYEQQNWPSLFNTDHKNTFSLDRTRKDIGRSNHFNVYNDIIPILEKNNMEIKEVRLEDHRYDYSLPKGLDQTTGLRDALAQICFIARKKH